MRLRYVPITPNILLEAMKVGQDHINVQLVENGLPKDTKLVRMGHDGFGWVNLIVESLDFEDLEEGAEIPRHPTPLFRKVY